MFSVTTFYCGEKPLYNMDTGQSFTIFCSLFCCVHFLYEDKTQRVVEIIFELGNGPKLDDKTCFETEI